MRDSKLYNQLRPELQTLLESYVDEAAVSCAVLAHRTGGLLAIHSDSVPPVHPSALEHLGEAELERALDEHGEFTVNAGDPGTSSLHFMLVGTSALLVTILRAPQVPTSLSTIARQVSHRIAAVLSRVQDIQ